MFYSKISMRKKMEEQASLLEQKYMLMIFFFLFWFFQNFSNYGLVHILHKRKISIFTINHAITVCDICNMLDIKYLEFSFKLWYFPILGCTWSVWRIPRQILKHSKHIQNFVIRCDIISGPTYVMKYNFF